MRGFRDPRIGAEIAFGLTKSFRSLGEDLPGVWENEIIREPEPINYILSWRIAMGGLGFAV